MGDMAQAFREQREYSKKKRAQNREYAVKYLERNDIPFSSKNGGAHLIVEGPTCFIDYWPGTGKWIPRDTKKQGFGLRGLIDHIRGTK